MTQTPKMLFIPTNGFYCTYCDYYFHPELDRSGLPDLSVKWIGRHHKVEYGGGQVGPTDCPLEGKMFGVDIIQVYPEAREVGK